MEYLMGTMKPLTRHSLGRVCYQVLVQVQVPGTTIKFYLVQSSVDLLQSDVFGLLVLETDRVLEIRFSVIHF